MHALSFSGMACISSGELLDHFVKLKAACSISSVEILCNLSASCTSSFPEAKSSTQVFLKISSDALGNVCLHLLA